MAENHTGRLNFETLRANSTFGVTCERVTDGARTRDPKDHNLVLCQLSYGHQIAKPDFEGGQRICQYEQYRREFPSALSVDIDETKVSSTINADLRR